MMPATHDQTFEQRLARLSLSSIIAHVASETGLPQAELARAEDLYRKFLTLKARYPQQSFVPPRIVDTLWHAHITSTRKYMADCDMLFGEYLHHTPDVENAETLFETTTVPSMQAEFGINLRAYGLQAPQHYLAADCKG